MKMIAFPPLLTFQHVTYFVSFLAAWDPFFPFVVVMMNLGRSLPHKSSSNLGIWDTKDHLTSDDFDHLFPKVLNATPDIEPAPWKAPPDDNLSVHTVDQAECAVLEAAPEEALVDRKPVSYQNARHGVATQLGLTRDTQSLKAQSCWAINALKEPSIQTPARPSIDARISEPSMNILRELKNADAGLFENQWVEKSFSHDARLNSIPTLRKRPPERASRSEDFMPSANFAVAASFGGINAPERRSTIFATAPPTPSHDIENPLRNDLSIPSIQPSVGIPTAPKPHQIRLRRATKPFVPSKLIEDMIYLYDHPTAKLPIAKSSIAEAATTKTAVHLFAMQPSTVSEDSPTLTDATVRQRKEDTLNVLRTDGERRNEQEMVSDTGLINCGGSASSNGMNTNLVAWSWGSDHSESTGSRNSGPCKSKNVGIATDAPSEHSVEDGKRPQGPSTKSKRSSKSVHVQAADTTGHSNAETPMEDDELIHCRRATDPTSKPLAGGIFKSSPRPYSPQSSGISKQIRKQLLGNRKPSNLPADEEHFKSHRDSLMLTHQRLWNGHSDAMGVEGEMSNERGGTGTDNEAQVQTMQCNADTGQESDVHADQHQSDCETHRSSRDATESRPINSIATLVRSPSKGIPKNARPDKHGGWLSLSEELPSPTSKSAPSGSLSPSLEPQQFALPEAQYPLHDGRDKGSSTPHRGFLSLAPTMHEPAPTVGIKKGQQPLPAPGCDEAVAEEAPRDRKERRDRGRRTVSE
ncbi:MAG: hypothetical protein Q9162_001803 [Coniocarpon cinnabarinum]